MNGMLPNLEVTRMLAGHREREVRAHVSQRSLLAAPGRQARTSRRLPGGPPHGCSRRSARSPVASTLRSPSVLRCTADDGGAMVARARRREAGSGCAW